MIIKQNKLANQTFVLMIKNKYGLMHHFDFFNSIILCNKGNLVLKYIESIFDFQTLTLKTSNPEFLTNELRSLVKSEYENNVKCLYLNNLLETLKFKRITNLNVNYAINNFELNFLLTYSAQPPIDVIFNNSNNEYYDKIFKKLLKYNIYNQICVKIFQILKNNRFSNISESKSKNSQDSKVKLIMIFNKSFKIFKGILSYIYQQIIEKIWIEMIKKIESACEVFQIIKYHMDALKSINNFFQNNFLIIYFENLCNDFSQLYLKIIVSDYYDSEKEKNDFFDEIIEKLNDDNKNIMNYRDSLGEMSTHFVLKNYL
jgi:hypothetical protein